MKQPQGRQHVLPLTPMLFGMGVAIILSILYLSSNSNALTTKWDSAADFQNVHYGQPQIENTQVTPSGSVILEQIDGEFVSSGTVTLDFNSGSISKFKSMNITTIVNPGTTEVKLRFRTAGTQGTLGSATWTSYYTEFPANIEVQNQQWIQIEASLLTNDPTQTPVIQDGELTYVSEKDEDPRRKFYPAPNPKNPKIKLTSDGKPHLTWERMTGKKAENIYHYIILKGFDNYPVYGHPIAILPKSTTQYIDNDVEWDRTYRYYVRTMGEFNQTDNNRILLEVVTPPPPPKKEIPPPPLRLSADIKPVAITVFTQTNNKIASLIDREAKEVFSDYYKKYGANSMIERLSKLQNDPAGKGKIISALEQKNIRGNKNKYARLEIWHNGDKQSLITSKIVKLDQLGVGKASLYLKPGVYTTAIYIPGSLRKTKKNVTLQAGGTMINFAEGNDPYFTLGDLTGDGKINSLDFSQLAKQWSSNNQNADINFDGIINALDFAVLYKNWNKSDNF